MPSGYEGVLINRRRRSVALPRGLQQYLIKYHYWSGHCDRLTIRLQAIQHAVRLPTTISGCITKEQTQKKKLEYEGHSHYEQQ